MAAMASMQTPLTQLLGMQNPVMLAGMNGVSHGELAAAVSNAGGIGSIGGLTLTPKILRMEIKTIKENLKDPNLPFGVDLALPQIGGGARKTNHDYHKGGDKGLEELMDVIIEEKSRLFICAIGVPPKWVVEKLHKAGVVIANMVGSVRNAEKAVAAGADIVIAQGSEGGGHTGDVGTMPLIPQVVDYCADKTNFFGTPVQVVAAGGIYDGRGLAAALAMGATGVWVGTRFVATEESSAPKYHKDLVVSSGSNATVRSLTISGRPIRLVPNDWVKRWEADPEALRKMLEAGKVPFEEDLRKAMRGGLGEKEAAELRRGCFEAVNALIGQACGGVRAVVPAGDVVKEMVDGASTIIRRTQVYARL